MKENLLPVGEKVFDIRFGWGEIISVNVELEYPYLVSVEKTKNRYNLDGKYISFDLKPTLSLTEYDLYNGGFTPLSDYNKPKVGDFGFFWNNRDVSFQNLVYSKLIKIDIFNYDAKGEVWENFSKEIPDWFLKKMNK